MGQTHGLRTLRRDGLVTAGAFALTASGVALGVAGVPLALGVAVVPVLVFLVFGHVPARGAVVGCLGLALGATLVRQSPGVVPWGDLILLGMMALTANLAAPLASRKAQPTTAEAANSGRWVTVVVAYEGPADVSGSTVRLPAAPRPAPERRRLDRSARRERVHVEV
ncbi:MAG: hypothetical protein ABI353_09550 [Isosphaeraceae bacterium]